MPKYHLSVRIGSGQTQTTSTNPDWNGSFVFDAQESSEVVVQIFRTRKTSKAGPEIRAEVAVSAARCFQPECQSIEAAHYNLLSPGPSPMLQDRTLGDSFTVKTDDPINPFPDILTGLKDRLCVGLLARWHEASLCIKRLHGVVWDAKAGTAIGSAFKGHTSTVSLLSSHQMARSLRLHRWTSCMVVGYQGEEDCWSALDGRTSYINSIVFFVQAARSWGLHRKTR